MVTMFVIVMLFREPLDEGSRSKSAILSSAVSADLGFAGLLGLIVSVVWMFANDVRHQSLHLPIQVLLASFMAILLAVIIDPQGWADAYEEARSPWRG